LADDSKQKPDSGPAIRGIHLALWPRPGGSLEDDLALAREVGFDGVELAVTATHAIVGGRILPAGLKRLSSSLERFGGSVSLHAPLGLNLMDTVHAELHEAVARASLEVGRVLGARILVFHPGWLARHRLFSANQELMQWEAALLGEYAETARNFGMAIALENVAPFPEENGEDRMTYGLDPEMVAEQVRGIANPALTCCLDVSHAAISANRRHTDPAADIRAMSPDIGHIHLHDSFAAGPGPTLENAAEAVVFGLGDCHLPLGWGRLDFANLLNGLAVRPDTTMVLEILPDLLQAEILAESLSLARKLAEKPLAKALDRAGGF